MYGLRLANACWLEACEIVTPETELTFKRVFAMFGAKFAQLQVQVIERPRL
jgi:hypothetical protein